MLRNGSTKFQAPCLPVGRQIQNKSKIQISKFKTFWILDLGFGISAAEQRLVGERSQGGEAPTEVGVERWEVRMPE